MCNKSLREGHLPSSQKFAILSPIVKKAGLDADDVRSYRPISNLTFMSKLIERMVYQQLIAYLEKHNMLPRHQSGFRAHHSTETAVLKVISDISSVLLTWPCSVSSTCRPRSTRLIMISCWSGWQYLSGWPARLWHGYDHSSPADHSRSPSMGVFPQSA